MPANACCAEKPSLISENRLPGKWEGGFLVLACYRPKIKNKNCYCYKNYDNKRRNKEKLTGTGLSFGLPVIPQDPLGRVDQLFTQPFRLFDHKIGVQRE